MDVVLSIILIALIAWHVALGLAFSAYCGWELIIQPTRKLWLHMKPVPPAQPMIDLRTR